MYFLFNADRIMDEISRLSRVSAKLSGYLDQIQSVNVLDDDTYHTVLEKIKIYESNLSQVCTRTSGLSQGLSAVRDEYFRTENKLCGRENAIDWQKVFEEWKQGILPWIKKLSGLTEWFQRFQGNGSGGTTPVHYGIGGIGGPSLLGLLSGIIPFGFDDSADGTNSMSVWGGAGNGETNGFLGFIDAKYSGAYHILHFTESGKGGAEWNPEKGNMYASAQGKFAFSAIDAKGDINFWGIHKGTGEIKVGNVEATGDIGASLFQDNKFAPALYAKLKAAANVAQGSAEGQIGTDQYNVHLKGEGTVLGAEASAEGNVGRITTEEGTVRWGAKGKVAAEAYAAQGTVSGGFTIFGIRVDASVTGKAGGAGASAGGEITTGGVEGEVGLGLGVGAGVKIRVDWSKFKMPKFKWPW